MNTRQAANYCGVTESVVLYVARRDGIGTKKDGRWSFTIDELDKAFGAGAPFVAELQVENTQLREAGRKAIQIIKQLSDHLDADGKRELQDIETIFGSSRN